MNSLLINKKRIAVLCMSMLIVAGTVHAKNYASFDCTKAKTKVEKLICSDAALSIIDNELASTYRQFLTHSQDKKRVIASQRHWLRVWRNVCDNQDCLMQAYVARDDELTGKLTALLKKGREKKEHSEPSKDEHAAASDTLETNGPYHFTLTQGKGIAVCGAYLKRLNSADYSAKPPYCNIPEATRVPGFTPLHRLALTAKQVQTLYERVSGFMDNGKQGSKEEDEAYDARLKRLGQPPHTVSLADIKKWLQEGEVIIWRYDPPIDINNDGKPDNVILWQGIPVNTYLGTCGVANLVGPDARIFYRQSQVAFILNANNDRLDTAKTRAIFGHPSGYRLPDGTLLPQFRPVGNYMGIFKYQGRYYFETFFNSTWGDFNNKRAHDADLKNILAVFLRQHNKTKQVCEFHMTGNH